MTIERAIILAAQFHEGQTEKAGAPYILHPLRVMHRVTSDTARLAAVLHDIVEDTDCTFKFLESEGLPPEVLAAVRLLTRTADVPYDEYIAKLSQNRVAVEVKLADLEDNLNVMRLTSLEEKDLVRLNKYLKTRLLLLDCLNEAN